MPFGARQRFAILPPLIFIILVISQIGDINYCLERIVCYDGNTERKHFGW